tara:strand:+ start:271 stop:390 length:120 start_codon:yes stop_codon:yes gene_type:complete
MASMSDIHTHLSAITTCCSMQQLTWMLDAENQDFDMFSM